MPRFQSFAIATLSLIASFVGAAHADVVYVQPAQSPVVSARSSQFVTPPGAFNFQTFDNFTLNADTAIAAVHWQGAYLNTLIDPTDAPTAPNATGFGVNFYADNAGLPGALLSTATFSPSGANESFVGNQFAPNLNLTLAIFDYDVVLSSAFVASANTAYWLSVFAFSPAPSLSEAQWGWTGGTGGDGFSVQNGVSVTLDRSVALTTAVPEPAMIILWAAGLLLLFGVRRSRLFGFNR